MWSMGNIINLDFYPRPPRGGRRVTHGIFTGPTVFLSTPSARRATEIYAQGKPVDEISIHALREEGDPKRHDHGKHRTISIHALREEGDPFTKEDLKVYKKFLSTPSARRATMGQNDSTFWAEFLSTPSARRAT